MFKNNIVMQEGLLHTVRSITLYYVTFASPTHTGSRAPEGVGVVTYWCELTIGSVVILNEQTT